MQKLPLNSLRDFVTWPHLNPGNFLDHNPGFVRFGQDDAWAVICRHTVPPEPGRGSIWAVRVDGGMMPTGIPALLIGDGIDPRVILLGDLALVFYTTIERNPEGKPNGSLVGLAIFAVDGDQWRLANAYQMPKHPIVNGRTAGAHESWEKNWIPFAIDPTHVGLIYSHDPWYVLTLRIDAEAAPQFEDACQSPAVTWDYGLIRGGTPPVRYDDDHLITFFHAAERIGSREVYSVGACVFQARHPYAPTLVTADPLILAPYRTGAHRFGWRSAVSVVFPMGTERVADGYRLLCGRDDGEVAHFDVYDGELRDRLAPVRARAAGTVHDYSGGAARLPLQGLLYVPDPIPGIPELPMIKFLQVLAGHGRCFVDVGAHIGFYSMGLAPGFDRVVSFEPSRFQYSVLKRNRALNDYDHVTCEHVALGETAGEAMLSVLSYEGGLNTLAPDVVGASNVLDRYVVPVETLDARGLTDVDLMKIDVEGFEIPVLRGAARTIAASRPVILIEVWEQPERRQKVQEVMNEFGYGFEFMFPTSPELAICLPRERRHEFTWFI